MRQASLVGVNLRITAPSLQVAQAPTTEGLFLKGADKAQKRDYQGAINDFNQALKLILTMPKPITAEVRLAWN
ncbi:MAG: hypothetical protein WBA39_08140 [Rivularia sp. (in: cyanobacteria)]